MEWTVFILIGAMLVVGVFMTLYFTNRDNKKFSYKATIFTCSSETLPPKKDKDGKVIFDYGDFNYTYKSDMDYVDVIVTEDNKKHYLLRKAKREITSVDQRALLNPLSQEVIVVKFGDEYYLVQPSINKDKIFEFDAIPHDVKNLLRSEISIRNERYKNKMKGLLAYLPFILGIILVIGMVGTISIIGNIFKDLYAQQTTVNTYIADQNQQITGNMKEMMVVMRDMMRELDKRDIIKYQNYTEKQNISIQGNTTVISIGVV
jgi:hypothetical protein